MGNLYRTLRRRLDANARRAVEVYTRELADYRSLAAEIRGSAAMLDFAVTLRRRTIDLAAEERPFTEQDQAYMSSVGMSRGEVGVSLASQRQVLLLHANLTLREIHEAAGPNDLADVMCMLGWVAHHGLTAQNAYTHGYLKGQERFLPVEARMQLLAGMLLADEPAAAQLARELDLPVPDHYLVTVARIAGGRPDDRRRDHVVRTLLTRHHIPLTWPDPEEFVALVPCGDAGPIDGQAAARSQALSLVRDFAELSGPCSAGAAAGRTLALADPVALARKICRAAPVERVPSQVYGVVDVFAELGAAQMPQVDQWLRELTWRLANGPDLVATLDAYYRNDMNRMRTAVALRVHPRTLDYRLRRVRELVGIEPGSTRGVRVLSTAVTRILAEAWRDRQ
ncbi:helix-turn-helix domain-containing protein [Actinomadura sp. ATCC 31491]|uniref:Helix-turn-helix domain-containing protein n=1 Tax=Actinomadura luzonensis TaxID=2805427 RepID=A0ABT0G708_9ACTN|nr:helix-turn-helix domain-containing protein [Actinomadura luzonensis]MCK2220385.1 helix-turn-helix domain-containing protein [Actinomadura luzonensis]